MKKYLREIGNQGGKRSVKIKMLQMRTGWWIRIKSQIPYKTAYIMQSLKKKKKDEGMTQNYSVFSAVFLIKLPKCNLNN